MGRLADEMSNLRHKMRELADDRKELISHLKTDSDHRRQEVQQTLADFRRERFETVTPFLQEIKQERQKYTHFVQELQSETAELRAGLRRELDKKARQQYEKTRASVAELREATNDLLTSCRKDRSQQAAKLRAELTAFREELLASMPDFEALARERSRSVSDIRKGVYELRQNSRRELAEMAQTGRVERHHFVHTLQQDVAELSRNSQHKRHAVISELSAMRQAWHGDLQPRQETVHFSDASPGNYSVKSKPPASAMIESADDLTRIDGIGPVRARLLQASGIQTFAQLAMATAAELLAVVGDSGVPVDVEKWIAEASRLST